MKAKKILMGLIASTGIMSQAQAQVAVAKLNHEQIAKLSGLFQSNPDQAVLDIYSYCKAGADCVVETEEGKVLRLSQDIRTRLLKDQSSMRYDGSRMMP